LAVEEINPTPEGNRRLLAGSGYDIDQLTANEFAKFVVEFYKALLKLGIDKKFARELTKEFLRKP
jgi:hypothetical protein